MATGWIIVLVVLNAMDKLGADSYHENKEVEQVLEFYEAGENDRFSATNCHLMGSENLPMVLNYMDVKPFPLQLGETLFLNISFNLNQDIGADGNRIEMSLSVRLKTPWGFTEICEIVGEKVCHTNNVCQYIRDIKLCPKGLPSCHCPLKKGDYNLTNIPLDNIHSLPVDITGTFDVTIKIKEQGKHIGCIETHLCISRCKPQLFYYPP